MTKDEEVVGHDGEGCVLCCDGDMVREAFDNDLIG